LGEEAEAGWPLLSLGRVRYYEGDLAAAGAFYRESLMVGQKAADQSLIARCHFELSRLELCRNDRREARSHRAAALAIWRGGDGPLGPAVLRGAARLAVAEAEFGRAARLLGAEAALREASGLPLPPVEWAEHEGCRAAVRAALGAEAFDAFW